MSVRTKQPQGGPGRIDPGNPLGRGLAFLVNAGDQASPYDIVNRRSLSTGASTLTRTTTPQGRAYKSALANAGAQLAGTTRLVTDDGAFTGEFSITVHANPASSTSPNIVYGPMGGAAPESYFQFNGTLASLAGAGRASFITPGGTGVEAFGVVDGLFHTFTAVRRADNSLEMWVDGALKATSSFVGAIATAARIDTLYGYFSGNYGCPFDVPLVVAHNRALLGSEVKALHANPWQLIEAPQPIYLYNAPAAGGVNGSLTATLGSASSSSAGTVSIAGSLTSTLGAATVTSAGTVAVDAALSKTLGALTASSTGTVQIAGSGNSTLGALVSASAGSVAISGALTKTLDALTSAAAAAPPNEYSATIMRANTINSVSTMTAIIAFLGGTLAESLNAATTMGAKSVCSNSSMSDVHNMNANLL